MISRQIKQLPLSVSPKSLLCRYRVAAWRRDMGGFESLEHEVNGTDPQHRCACVCATLIILAVTTTTSEPSTSAFHHPTFGQQDEALAPFRTSHHCQAPVARGLRFDPLVETLIMVL